MSDIHTVKLQETSVVQLTHKQVVEPVVATALSLDTPAGRTGLVGVIVNCNNTLDASRAAAEFSAARNCNAIYYSSSGGSAIVNRIGYEPVSHIISSGGNCADGDPDELNSTIVQAQSNYLDFAWNGNVEVPKFGLSSPTASSIVRAGFSKTYKTIDAGKPQRQKITGPPLIITEMRSLTDISVKAIWAHIVFGQVQVAQEASANGIDSNLTSPLCVVESTINVTPWMTTLVSSGAAVFSYVTVGGKTEYMNSPEDYVRFRVNRELLTRGFQLMADAKKLSFGKSVVDSIGPGRRRAVKRKRMLSPLTA